MPAYWRVSEVIVIEDHALWVRFIDGLEGVVRFLPGFFRGVFAHLSDPAKFQQVTVVGGAVTWPTSRLMQCMKKSSSAAASGW